MKPTVFTFKALVMLGLTLAIGITVSGQVQSFTAGIIYGKIISDNRKSGVQGATIQLFRKGNENKLNSLIGTTISSKRGEFVFSNLQPGSEYGLVIHSTGYKDRIIVAHIPNLKVNNSSASADLGTILLDPDISQLDTINLYSNKQILQLYPDKKVFSVGKDLSTTGGTAEEALKNIPGILVDADGNISMRNSQPQIFVDGRPSSLSLSQIPAEQVEWVELMTNPSAKYDASSVGGIINIILKKNRASGYNGTLRTGIDSRWQPMAGGDINVRKKRVNIFAAAQYNARKSLGTSSSQRIEHFSSGSLISNQKNAPENKGYFGFSRAGIDYFISNRTTLSASGNYGKGFYKVKDEIDILRDSIPVTGTSGSKINRSLGADINFRSVGAMIALKHNFPEQGKEFTVDFNFNNHQNDNTSQYQSKYYDAAGNIKPPVGAELATGRGISRFYTFQSDFTNPGPNLSKFESGIRVAARNYESYNRNFRETPAGSLDFRLLPATGVEFNFEDIVFAAYGNYLNSYKKFSYQLGVRVESSFYEGKLKNTNKLFKTDYPLNLFPSIYLSQKFTEKQSIHLNYSRKINRPNFFQILPFVDFSDSLNLNIGNPSLLPEFANIGELVYQHDYKNNQSFFATVYVRQSGNLISRYQYRAPNTDPAVTDSVIYNSFANAKSSYTYGLELINRNRLGNWWEILSSVNLFDVHLNADNLAGVSNQQQKSWFAKMTHNFKLPSHFTLQLSGEYQARTILPPGFSRNSNTAGFGGGMYGFTANISQGYVKPIYGVDFSIKKDLFKKQSASISLQVNDIFRTRTYETVASSSFFDQENFRRRDPQVVRLNFSWRFGKLDASLERRRNNKPDTDNTQGQSGVGG